MTDEGEAMRWAQIEMVADNSLRKWSLMLAGWRGGGRTVAMFEGGDSRGS